jgi:dCTP deaminase
MIDSAHERRGVLPNHQLEEAIRQGAIGVASGEVPKENIQPASVDLRLGPWAYQMQCSFLPAGQLVEERLKSLIIDKISLRKDGAVLAPGQPYLIPLKEELDLPEMIRAKANPKSSTGRADVFTRVITDRSHRFDEIEPGYRGRLYLEVVPLSFPVRVAEDLTLNQLRLTRGQDPVQLTDREVADYHRRTRLLTAEGQPIHKLQLGNGLFLGLDLRGDNGRYVGYKAKGSPPLLDLRAPRKADPDRYWDRVRSEPGNRIVLQPRAFYLLMSYEAVTIPPDLAAEMTAYDPTSGELRTHYAGFFDPGFGYDRDGEFQGSTAALEVRAHDVPFMIEDRQPVCKLTFERMAEEPSQLYGDAIGSNYQRQTETLGKHFVPSGNYPKPRAQNKTQAASDEDLLDLFRAGEVAAQTVQGGDDG